MLVKLNLNKILKNLKLLFRFFFMLLKNDEQAEESTGICHLIKSYRKKSTGVKMI